jgi:multiple antibiotic resistance protein
MLKDFLHIFVPMFIVIDPIGIVPIYLGLTASEDAKDRAIIINRAVLVALIITFALVVLVLRSSNLILRIMGRTGVSVLERIMGLLLSGLSVQFVVEGAVRLGLLVSPLA